MKYWVRHLWHNRQVGVLAGTALGSAVGGVLDVQNFLRDRRARGWVAVDQQITKLTGS